MITVVDIYRFVILVTFGLTAISVADDELPILGEQAVFSLKQEVEIGRDIYDQLVSHGLVETDVLLNRYINDLGTRLLSAVNNRIREYHFFIVRDHHINAFALPGGYIGINVGLILSATNQDQLASVLAHEIAHVRLRHGIRLMEKSNKASSMMLLTVVAGLLVGSRSDLGAALVYGGTAGGQQAITNYTRDFEYEADRVGIDLLQTAGFDGRSMADFMRMLGSVSGNSERQNIEYLRTHPISDNRISEIESRLQQLNTESSRLDYFPLFQDYLRVITDKDALLNNSQFGRALATMKSGQVSAAHDVLKDLYTNDQDNVWYGYVYAENLRLFHKPLAALGVYRQLLDIYPDDFVLLLKLMQLLQEQGHTHFDEALAIARRLENRYPDNKSLIFKLVDLYRETDQSLRKTLAQANYYRLDGSFDQAIRLYNQVLNFPDIDLATTLKVREKLARLQDQIMIKTG